MSGTDIGNPIELFHMLRASWSTETGRKWLPENPARGQCSVTALVVQDLLGGEVLKTGVNGQWHFYNRIGGRRWDMTMGQFDAPIGYDDLPATREEAMADTSPEKYRLLCERLAETGYPWKGLGSD